MKKILLSLMIFTFLVGCWDQRLLKDYNLILAIGYDTDEEYRVHKTVTFPEEETDDPQQELVSEKSKVITTSGDTIQDADQKLEQILPLKFDRSKSRVLLLGESLAKEGILSMMDSIYRDPRGPLDALVAVVDGKAKDALLSESTYNLYTSEFYYELLKNTGDNGLIKDENVQSISPMIFSEGKDVVLPYIRLFGKEGAKIDGSALFSGEKMTGRLSIKESGMLLLLMDEMKKNIEMNIKINNTGNKRQENYVHFAVRKLKRHKKITKNNGEKLKANLDYKLRIEILEFPADHLDQFDQEEMLAETIEKELYILAKQTLKKLQEAGNDALGIGRGIRAFHHSIWEALDWKEKYKELAIEPSFHVDIVRHGIIF